MTIIATNTPEFLSKLDGLKYYETFCLKCPECLDDFNITKKLIKDKFNNYNKGVNIFCSWNCSLAHKKQKIVEVSCTQCAKTFTRKLCDIVSSIKRAKTSNTFCSFACNASYTNAHKTTGYRRSKMEAYIEAGLNNKYPELNIKYNISNIIGLELDIYIEELNLAFEINGVLHYKPIFGIDSSGISKKFIRTQENDKAKIQKCFDKNIKLYHLDISAINKFKPEHGETFLNKIIDTIEYYYH